jgi:hypothetical protein
MSGDERLWSPTSGFTLADCHLAGHVFLDYVVMAPGAGGGVVRVHFPDETRALLEMLSWGPGMSILEALDDVGRRHLEGIAESRTHGDHEPCPSSGAVEASAHFQFHIPLYWLRSALSSLGSA